MRREPGIGHRPDQASSSSSHDSDAFWTSGELRGKKIKRKLLDISGTRKHSFISVKLVDQDTKSGILESYNIEIVWLETEVGVNTDRNLRDFSVYTF